jgi:hypothetical protein
MRRHKLRGLCAPIALRFALLWLRVEVLQCLWLILDRLSVF